MRDIDEVSTIIERRMQREREAEGYMGFGKLKGELAKKGATSPGGLAAYIGRKKYGKGPFQKSAAKGKKMGKKSSEGGPGSGPQKGGGGGPRRGIPNIMSRPTHAVMNQTGGFDSAHSSKAAAQKAAKIAGGKVRRIPKDMQDQMRGRAPSA